MFLLMRKCTNCSGFFAVSFQLAEKFTGSTEPNRILPVMREFFDKYQSGEMKYDRCTRESERINNADDIFDLTDLYPLEREERRFTELVGMAYAHIRLAADCDDHQTLIIFQNSVYKYVVDLVEQIEDFISEDEVRLKNLTAFG